jgi:hypothetical protein
MIYPLHENFAQHSLEITPLVPASETMEEYSDINGDVFHGNNPKNTPPLIDLGPRSLQIDLAALLLKILR